MVPRRHFRPVAPDRHGAITTHRRKTVKRNLALSRDADSLCRNWKNLSPHEVPAAATVRPNGDARSSKSWHGARDRLVISMTGFTHSLEVPEKIRWPRIHCGSGALERGLEELRRTERLSTGHLQACALLQLEELVDFSRRHVPFYRERLPDLHAGQQLDYSRWRSIPILERSEVQEHGLRLRAAILPAKHGRIHEVETSGSTGRPIRAAHTDLSLLIWSIVRAREHAWHERDSSGTLAAIRWFPDGINEYPDGGRLPNWGGPTSPSPEVGPSYALSITATPTQQAEWLGRVQPHYLLLYPSLIPELALACRRLGIRLQNLRHVRTVAECVEPAVRELCRSEWGVPLHDVYSAQEVGYIALQCPVEEHLHVQAETALVEVLDEGGAPCAPGQVGRIVVTSLHNFAMPLIRYAIGDYAEVGEPCICGRGLPVLTRIFGRFRSMVTFPDGSRAWPRLGELRYSQVLPISQFQVAQTGRERLELRVVAQRRGTEQEEEQLRTILCGRIGYPFDVDVRYVDRIERSARGKFEDFKSELAE
jgi:phenylacetate-CoA ligase